MFLWLVALLYFGHASVRFLCFLHILWFHYIILLYVRVGLVDYCCFMQLWKVLYSLVVSLFVCLERAP